MPMLTQRGGTRVVSEPLYTLGTRLQSDALALLRARAEKGIHTDMRPSMVRHNVGLLH